MLSVVGFVFSICVATSVAAKGGAVAGLGIALVSKPIMFEVNTQCITPLSFLSHTLFYVYVHVSSTKWNPSLRTPLKWGHLSNTVLCPIVQFKGAIHMGTQVCRTYSEPAQSSYQSEIEA